MAFSLQVNDWTKINIDAARLIFQQADAMLRSTVETYKAMADRAITMIQILSVAIGADLGYLLTKVSEAQFLLAIDFQALALAMLIMSWAFYQAFKMYELVTVADVGSEPRKLATQNLLSVEDYQELSLLLNEIEMYQDRIEHNLQENRVKANQYRGIVKTLYLGAGAVVIFTTISLLIRTL